MNTRIVPRSLAARLLPILILVGAASVALFLSHLAGG